MRAASLAVVAAALVVAGCGGGGNSKPPPHIHLTPLEQRGKTLFIQRCGACHALADAGTSGAAGKAFDTPRTARRVLTAIANGPGLMSPNLLTGKDAAAVAAYVAAATGAKR